MDFIRGFISALYQYSCIYDLLTICCFLHRDQDKILLFIAPFMYDVFIVRSTAQRIQCEVEQKPESLLPGILSLYRHCWRCMGWDGPGSTWKRCDEVRFHLSNDARTSPHVTFSFVTAGIFGSVVALPLQSESVIMFLCVNSRKSGHVHDVLRFLSEVGSNEVLYYCT